MANTRTKLDPNKPIAVVKNRDGSVSTVRTISVNIDGKEVVIPTVHPDGYIMSADDAINRYIKTGEYFDEFDTVDEASKYAEDLHKSQAELEELKDIIKKDVY